VSFDDRLRVPRAALPGSPKCEHTGNGEKHDQSHACIPVVVELSGGQIEKLAGSVVAPRLTGAQWSTTLRSWTFCLLPPAHHLQHGRVA
jgi:hypothetical protein